MKIAALSDIHDNIWNLEKAVALVKQHSCEAIIFCGDFCSPFVTPYLVDTGLLVYAVFGNNDEDQWSIVRRADSDKFKVWGLTDQFAEIELDGKKIAVYHYPKLAKYIAKSEEYDAVFYGHNPKPKLNTLARRCVPTLEQFAVLFPANPARPRLVFTTPPPIPSNTSKSYDDLGRLFKV